MAINRSIMRPLTSLLGYLALIAAVIIPVVGAGIWIFWASFGHQFFLETLPDYDLLNIGLGTRILGAAIFLTVGLIVAYGLLGLRKTFTEASRARALSEKSVNGFRRFAWVMLALIPITFVQSILTVLLLSLGDPSKSAVLEISVGTDGLADTFFALMLVVVAEIFSEGQRANDENAAFL